MSFSVLKLWLFHCSSSASYRRFENYSGLTTPANVLDMVHNDESLEYILQACLTCSQIGE